jgi:hypothetical protein
MRSLPKPPPPPRHAGSYFVHNWPTGKFLWSRCSISNALLFVTLCPNRNVSDTDALIWMSSQKSHKRLTWRRNSSKQNCLFLLNTLPTDEVVFVLHTHISWITYPQFIHPYLYFEGHLYSQVLMNHSSYLLWGTNSIYICYVEESRPPLWSSGQSYWLRNWDVLCLLCGMNWIYVCYVEESRPPLWSSGRRSLLKNGYVLCFLWGTNSIYICYVEESRPPLWSSGQSSLLKNGYVLCFLWGTNSVYICYVEESRPPLWSSGQRFWLKNWDVLCFLWGTNWIYVCYIEESIPPLW